MSGSDQEALQMSAIGREALPDVREWSGCPTQCPQVVGRPSLMFGSVRRPSLMSAIGQETPRMSGSGQEALPDVHDWSGVPH